MGGSNAYNYSIARKRLAKLLKELKALKARHRKINLWFLGDMIEGMIRRHEDFNLTTQDGEYVQVDIAIDIITDFIRKVSQMYGEVVVHSVVGNHGRSTGLNRVPNVRIENNADWLVMEQARKHLSVDVSNVEIHNHKVPFPIVELEGGLKALISHGDRNGLATSGATKLSTSFAKAQAIARGEPVNLVAVGHQHHNKFEEVGDEQFFVMNASLCGTDPYAKNALMLTGVCAQSLLTIRGNRVVGVRVIYLDEVK